MSLEILAATLDGHRALIGLGGSAIAESAA
jgi:hypothetical protein